MNYFEIEQIVNHEAKADSKSVLPHDWNSVEIVNIGSAIIAALILAVFQDIQHHNFTTVNTQELGWRNKYNIHLLSGVSQKQIYKECGVLEKLIEKGVLEKRPSKSRWGRQKHQYRYSFSYLHQQFNREPQSIRSQ
ncbi:hypothetical protein EU528_06365 [Candidatus Thorarchaeota archaeon]|nr:MAG: hypothetical protein EU528_06365 [Candidatus Thorarchaeota archaeon]